MPASVASTSSTDGHGTCTLCFTGRYEIVSTHTLLAVRSDDTLIRIEHVPVVECDTCGYLLLAMDDAPRLATLLDQAERTEPESVRLCNSTGWTVPVADDDSTLWPWPVIGCGHPLERHTATGRCLVEGCDGCPDDVWRDTAGELRHLTVVIEEAARLLMVTDAPRGQVADFLLSDIEGEHRLTDEDGGAVIRWPGWDQSHDDT